jgi:hypothetical protein
MARLCSCHSVTRGADGPACGCGCRGGCAGHSVHGDGHLGGRGGGAPRSVAHAGRAARGLRPHRAHHHAMRRTGADKNIIITKLSSSSSSSSSEPIITRCAAQVSALGLDPTAADRLSFLVTNLPPTSVINGLVPDGLRPCRSRGRSVLEVWCPVDGPFTPFYPKTFESSA